MDNIWTVLAGMSDSPFSYLIVALIIGGIAAVFKEHI